MRRKGHRGNLPGKTIPIKSHPTKSFDNEELQSGVARGPVNVDQVMAANFKPELYIEKFPHGYDPFEGDVTALQRKVVWRPTTAQIKSGSTKKRTQYVNISSGNNGRGMVQHEKPFAPKNARYVEYKTSANVSGPVQHEVPVLEKNSDPNEVQSGAVYDQLQDVDHQYEKTDRPYRHTQAQYDQTTVVQTDMAPELNAEYHEVVDQSRKHRNNPDYGYVAAVSGLQTPIDQDTPVRSAKANRGQVQAEIWTGNHYEYVAVNQFDNHDSKNARRQPTEDDYHQQSVPDYEDHSLQPVDETAIHRKDRRQQASNEWDQYANYDYDGINQDTRLEPIDETASRPKNRRQQASNERDQYGNYDYQAMNRDGGFDARDETSARLKNRRQQADDQRDHYSGVGDHNEIQTEDPRDRWDAAEYRQGRRVQFAQGQEPFEERYDLEAPNDQRLNTTETRQFRRQQVSHDKTNADYEVDHRGTRLNEEHDVQVQRRKSNAREGRYVEQEQLNEGEAGYDIPDFDVIIPAELSTEQRRIKQLSGQAISQGNPGDDYDPGVAEAPTEQRRIRQSSGQAISQPDPAEDYDPGVYEKEVAGPVKAKNRRTTRAHQVNSSLDAKSSDGTRTQIAKSEKGKTQGGSTYANREAAEDNIEYEAKTEQKPPSTRRQYSAKQAHETATAEPPIPVQGTKESGRRNHRQASAKPQSERAAPEFEDADGTRLVERQQKGRGVDEFDITKHAGVENPNEENAGIDPVTLDAAQSKKHLARESTVDANLSAEVNEAGASKDGNNSNRRARVPMITPRIEARAKPNLIYRRKKKEI